MKIYPPGKFPDFETMALGERVLCRTPDREGHFNKIEAERSDVQAIRNKASKAGLWLNRSFETQAMDPGTYAPDGNLYPPGVVVQHVPYKGRERRRRVEHVEQEAPALKLPRVLEYPGGLRISVYDLREGKNPTGDPLKARLLAMNKGDTFTTRQGQVKSMVARMGTSTGQAFRVEEEDGLWHVTCLEDDIPEGAVWSEKKDRLTGWD